MTGRRLGRGAQYLRSLRTAGVSALSPQFQAILAAERALASAEILPGPLDYEVLIPPVRRAWVRRISGHNLWLYYSMREDVVYVLRVAREPPVPIA